MLRGYFTYLLLFISFSIYSQITPSDMITKMDRGINLGNILSAPKEGNWAPALTETYLDDVKSVGFKTVRIPMDFYGDRTSGNTSTFSKAANTVNNYNGQESDYVIDATYLNRIEEIITWSLDKGLITILDVHGGQLKENFLYTFSSKDKWSAYYTHPTSAKRAADNQKFRAIWKQIASRFKNYSDNLIFEIVNEPYFWLSAAEMNTLNKDIITIIRNSGSKNSHRNIIITGGGKNAYEAPLQIGDDVLNTDNHLIATFHYYKPREFTASSEQEHNDFTWGSNADKSLIDTHFTTVKNWADNKNIPVLLGEFGADNANGIDYESGTNSNYGGPEDASRVTFHKYLAEKALELGFAFTVWDAGDKSNKTIYRVSNRGWVTNVRNALLGVTCLDTQLIKNADIECGFDNSWKLFVQTPAVSSISDISDNQSRNNSTSLKIDVTNAGGSFNKTILKNTLVNSNSYSGKTINFSTFAKGSVNSSQFKIRIKTITNGATLLSSSSNFNLSNSTYQLFEYTYKIPENTTSIEFQVLCGKTAGVYYFDDFFAQIEQTLSVENLVAETPFKIYPNPTNKHLHISSIKKIEKVFLYNTKGNSFHIKTLDNRLNLSGFSDGLYFLKILFKDKTINNSKILISKNL